MKQQRYLIDWSHKGGYPILLCFLMGKTMTNRTSTSMSTAYTVYPTSKNQPTASRSSRSKWRAKQDDIWERPPTQFLAAFCLQMSSIHPKNDLSSSRIMDGTFWKSINSPQRKGGRYIFDPSPQGRHLHVATRAKAIANLGPPKGPDNGRLS